MSFPKFLDDACEEIDASMFSSGDFMDHESWEKLRWYMARWTRELVNFDKLDEET